MNEVLVLNASYEPLRIVPARRALILILQRKAEIIEAGAGALRSAHNELTRPSVVRLLRYVAIPRVRHPTCTRRAVLIRDQETCQYCGSKPGRAQLTIDHILPRAQGGTTSWENVVAACHECNRRKGNRTPDQAGLALLSRPRQPSVLSLTMSGEILRHDVWRKYSYDY